MLNLPIPTNHVSAYVGRDFPLQFLIERRYANDPRRESLLTNDILPFLIWVVPARNSLYDCGTNHRVIYKPLESCIEEYYRALGLEIDRATAARRYVCECIGRLIE